MEWELGGGSSKKRTLTVTLAKGSADNFWPRLFQGQPDVDVDMITGDHNPAKNGATGPRGIDDLEAWSRRMKARGPPPDFDGAEMMRARGMGYGLGGW